ncbi:hypothetical protein [Streptomyces sp. CAU 1734]|uniref:hypothetical protein n=1 Tax=Streptomyces sp. CAU 1734 TaxID=3140360 RepID=UPI00326063F5
MKGLFSRKITVAEYLVMRGLPADWRFASPYGRTAAAIYRHAFQCEPGRAWRLINGRFRPVMAYRVSEISVLVEAWQTYPRTADLADE